jgi:hypothetical protein
MVVLLLYHSAKAWLVARGWWPVQNNIEQTIKSRFGWRQPVLLALIFVPLAALLAFWDRIPQDPGFHVFADARTCLGLQNFGNVASNLLFLVVGAIGMAWCWRNPGMTARRSWFVFFLGVALVFFGSGYYHHKPDDERLVWDRLPMAVAFMGLFSAMLTEHVSEERELALLVTSLAVGIGSVILWKYANDLRVYGWVQATPLVVIPYLIAFYPGRFTHRHYLLYGVAAYAVAFTIQYVDYGIYRLTMTAISGHSLKHMVAAGAPFFVYLMLRRRRSEG